MCRPLPAISVPVSAMMSKNDRLLLSLYYRWALQVLSAMSFMHSRSVYIKNFSSQLVWLRKDFSLAITGFICASAPEIEEELSQDTESKGAGSNWDGGELVRDEAVVYDEMYEGDFEGSVQEDL